MEFYVGMCLDLNEEEHGEIVEVTDDSIRIKSDSFNGWAKKSEITAAMEEWATGCIDASGTVAIL